MNPLNTIENYIFQAGALLMLIGSAAYVFQQSWAPYVFAAGSLAFALMQLKQRYEGPNFTVRRLRRRMVISDVLFLLTALFMLADHLPLLPINYLIHLQYVHNNWVIILLIAAILQLYSTHRIDRELNKEAKKR